jgi:hypothetical protein
MGGRIAGRRTEPGLSATVGLGGRLGGVGRGGPHEERERGEQPEAPASHRSTVAVGSLAN